VAQLDKDLNLVLISDSPGCGETLRDALQIKGINGTIRRLAPDERAVECAKRSGSFSRTKAPHVILFDFARPDDNTSSVLEEIAFCSDKPDVPVVLLTSSESEELLSSGEIGNDEAIMFSPTSLSLFVGKMHHESRDSFLRALRTLYAFGPILVSMPAAVAHMRRDRSGNHLTDNSRALQRAS